jgi:hypothetical protein
MKNRIRQQEIVERISGSVGYFQRKITELSPKWERRELCRLEFLGDLVGFSACFAVKGFLRCNIKAFNRREIAAHR